MYCAFSGECTVAHERSVDSFGEHTEKVELLSGEDRDHVEECVLNMPAENIARHELGGGHVFKRCIGEDLPCHLRLRKARKGSRFQHREIFRMRARDPSALREARL